MEFRRASPAELRSRSREPDHGVSGEPGTALDPGAVRTIRARGFDLVVRPAQGAADGHGRLSRPPDGRRLLCGAAAEFERGRAAPGVRMTGLSGRVFVFFDGLAPLEKDMAPGGLATPLDTLSAFRIP